MLAGMRNAGLVLALLLAAGSAGAQWEILFSGSTADLRGIDNVGKGIAWASGIDGTVLCTTDDGAHWQRCATPPDAEHLDFRGVQAFDGITAIVMSSGKGPLSRLYKTTDGCQTWKLLFTNPDPDGFWDVVRFDVRKPEFASTDRQTREHGLVIGDPVNGAFAIFETADSGNNWHPWGPYKTNRPAKARRGETVFAASDSSLAAPAIDEPFVFVTGGKGGARLFIPKGHSPFDAAFWTAFSTERIPIPTGDASGAFSVAANRMDIMIVGGDFGNPASQGNSAFLPYSVCNCYFTKPTSPPHGFRSAVAYDAASKTWITVGPNGTDISTDDGRNWRALRLGANDPPDADQHWNALSLPFVVGPHGRIGRLRAEALKMPRP